MVSTTAGSLEKVGSTWGATSRMMVLSTMVMGRKIRKPTLAQRWTRSIFPAPKFCPTKFITAMPAALEVAQ